jgi:hypothetical protein
MISLTSDNIARWRFFRMDWVHNLIQPNRVWVAGGALRTMVDPTEEVADYDLFFSSAEDAAATINYLKQHGWKLVFECPRGELYTFKVRGIKAQCITKHYYTSAEALLDSFDFTVCQAAYDGQTLTLTKDFIRSVQQKRLILNKVTYPVATINRLMKYKAKGYVVTEKLLVDLVTDIAGKQFDDNQMALYID